MIKQVQDSEYEQRIFQMQFDLEYLEEIIYDHLVSEELMTKDDILVVYQGVEEALYGCVSSTSLDNIVAP